MKFGITSKIAVLAAILVLGTGLIVGLLSHYGLRSELAIERRWVRDQRAVAQPAAMSEQADAAFDARLAAAQRRIVAGTLVFLVAAVALAVFLSSLLVRPLATIAAAARDVADGRASPALPTDRRDEIGSLARSFAAMEDRIRQRSLELESSQQRVQDILESAPDAMITLGRDGRILTANSPARRMFGYSSEELIGNSVDLLIPERFRSQHAQLVSTFFVGAPRARPLGRGLELLGRRRDGTEFPAEISLSPIEAGEGMVTVSAIRDITQRKRQEHELITAREAALHASRVKSEFLAKMSHEIRTPLNAIIGMAELLQRTPLNGQQQKYAHLLQSAGDNLLNVINDILDISRIESGQLELRRTDFLLPDVLGGVIDMMAVSAQGRGLELVLDLPEDVPTHLRGDPERLTQILVNLVGNAIKFTDSGEVVLRVRREPGGPGATTLQFAVRDTGIGIESVDQARIFESFTQVDSSITRTRPGTGLGLSISRQLVNMMSGRLWVDSRKGAGSTFSFTAEFEPAMANDGEAGAAMLPDFTGRRVLVVDDNDSSRAVVSGLLRARGATCAELESGAPVLGILREATGVGTPFDVLLVDEHMPDGDGFHLADRVRGDASLASLHVCLLVADVRGGALERLAEDGGLAHIVKPVKRAELLDAVQALLAAPGAAVAITGASANRSSESLPVLDVLLAEDSIDNQEIVQGYLADLPCRVTVASDGRAAVDLFQRGDFDIVLMDIQMPVLDGYSAIREIREWEAVRGVPPTPIVALTAYALAEEREKSLAAGSHAHVSKPVRRAELIATIQKMTRPVGAGGEGAGADLDPILRRRLPQYLERRRAEVAPLRGALAAGDFATIQTIGHKIKGHAGTYGLDALGDIGRALESAAAASDVASLTQSIAAMDELLRAC